MPSRKRSRVTRASKEILGRKRIIILSRSAAETHAMGRTMGGVLGPTDVVLLQGSLGAGKTTLSRGIADGLGVCDPSAVSSPSFTLINIYQGRVPVYHVDLYRLSGSRELEGLGLDDFIGSSGVTLVEWGERLPAPPQPAVVVRIEDLGDDARRLVVEGSAAWIASLKSARRARVAGASGAPV